MSPGEDMAEFVGQLDQLGKSGGFDPMSFISGETQFAALFIAPFSPSLQAAITRFLQDGTGAFSELPTVFTKQGMPADQAQQHVRQMCQAARGMLVCVFASDQSLATMPLFFFGHLESSFCQHVLKTCADMVKDIQPMSVALEQLRMRLGTGGQWPQLIAGRPGEGPADCWLKIAGSLVASQGGSFAALHHKERLSDLAHWCATAINAVRSTPDAHTLALLARLQVLAADQAAALQCLEGLLVAEGHEEEFVNVTVQLAEAAIRKAGSPALSAWLERTLARFEQRCGVSYDLRLVAFKLRAAAASAPELMLAAAQGLFAANRKCARQDLTREPLWQVTVPDPGVLLDTEAAATLVARSPVFIAKRLEHGTIPTFRVQVPGQPDQVRIPQAALLAWKQVMDAHRLLE